MRASIAAKDYGENAIIGGHRLNGELAHVHHGIAARRVSAVRRRWLAAWHAPELRAMAINTSPLHNILTVPLTATGLPLSIYVNGTRDIRRYQQTVWEDNISYAVNIIAGHAALTPHWRHIWHAGERSSIADEMRSITADTAS